jgi:Neuraminidase (sialidase)
MKNVNLISLMISSVILLTSVFTAGEPNVTRKILKEITIPTVDISDQTERHVIVAQGTKIDWQGHPNTLLMPDGITIFCVWQGREGVTPKNSGKGEQVQLHGSGGPFLKRSDDGGLTWSDRINVPSNWLEIGRGSPTIHRLVDVEGHARLFVFCRNADRSTFLYAQSEDKGKTWSPLRPLQLMDTDEAPIAGWTAPITILESVGTDGRRKHLMWYERSRDDKPAPGVIWQSASYDGGLTWGESKPVVQAPGASEPAIIRSPDGSQLLMLIRNEKTKGNSFFSVSNDKGETWSGARQLPLALTGDRHLARYAPDGRLVVVFRSRTTRHHTDNSHFMAWVGRYNDIIEGREGQFLIKLLHSYAGWDHSYPGLERLPDGTFVSTTYIKYQPRPEMQSVVSVRFRLEEVEP